MNLLFKFIPKYLPVSIINKYLNPTYILWEYWRPCRNLREFQSLTNINNYLYKEYKYCSISYESLEFNKLYLLQIIYKPNKYSSHHISFEVEKIKQIYFK